MILISIKTHLYKKLLINLSIFLTIAGAVSATGYTEHTSRSTVPSASVVHRHNVYKHSRFNKPINRINRHQRLHTYIKHLQKKYHLSRADISAQHWIIHAESRGEYNADNGACYGKYQLKYSYLHGNRTPMNQEKMAFKYVAHRYGSWSKAKQFHIAHGWY